MTTLNIPSLLSETVQPDVETKAAAPDSILDRAAGAANREVWNRVIDRNLVEWGVRPPDSGEEGFVPPTPTVIGLACQWAQRLRDIGVAAPQRVVPDGDGGIAFERSDQEWFSSLDILADRSVELLTFRNCRLVTRQPLQ